MRALVAVYSLVATPVFLVVLFGLFCPLILALPTLSARRAVGRASVWICLALVGIPLRVRGLERLPPGACIAVANHASYLDGLVLTAALPARFTFVVQDGAARWPFVGAVLARMGVAFITRERTRAAALQTRGLLKRLREGTSLAIFAEGTFVNEPGLLPFRSGAFVLAAKAGVPVVAVAIRGTRTVLGGGWWGLRWAPIRIDVLSVHVPEGTDKPAALALRDTVRAAILEACGEPDRRGV